MKKQLMTLLASAALVLPIGVSAAVTTVPVQAATTKKATTTKKTTTTKKATTKKTTKAKTTTYTISTSLKTIKTVSYHVKKAATYYKLNPMADKPTATLAKAGTLKTKMTYKGTKTIGLKKTAKSKTVMYTYLTGKGWVMTSALTKGAYMPAK